MIKSIGSRASNYDAIPDVFFNGILGKSRGRVSNYLRRVNNKVAAKVPKVTDHIYHIYS